MQNSQDDIATLIETTLTELAQIDGGVTGNDGGCIPFPFPLPFPPAEDPIFAPFGPSMTL